MRQEGGGTQGDLNALKMHLAVLASHGFIQSLAAEEIDPRSRSGFLEPKTYLCINPDFPL